MKDKKLDLEGIELKLSKIDIEILKLLISDCRISYAEIAREVNLSRMAVRERVMKMNDAGIIEKFTVRLNSLNIGLNIAIFLQITTNPSEIDKVADKLCEYSRIERVYATTGKNKLHVYGYVKDLEELNNFIFEEIYKINGIIQVDFNIITKTYKNNGIFV
ncbi:Lrp/AsnC family transcriptional regulator [Terrisporobacter sp.]|uniref:Lrp/AsnC family transcriptional regulator n=1 Tax=Terrisporobacter sp. TaxID=1965305 RepID=UPI0026221C60|nr:Lrp/AsnC family transcriptional regulator [Terrisporobacter sp.]